MENRITKILKKLNIQFKEYGDCIELEIEGFIVTFTQFDNELEIAHATVNNEGRWVSYSWIIDKIIGRYTYEKF